MKGLRRFELAFLFGKLFLIWLSWRIFTYIIGEESKPIHERFLPALSFQWESLNDWLRGILLNSSNRLLHMTGYQTHLESNYILRIEGSGGIALGNYCLGFQLMYYFAMLVLISALSPKKKVFGIATGIVIIPLLNIFRITGLVWIDSFAPRLRFISHDYIFNIIVFGMLLLFYWWLLNKKD